MTYTILTPSNAPVSVTLIREIRFKRPAFGAAVPDHGEQRNGTFSDSVAYTLPSNAGYGSYSVISRVSSSYGSAQREAYFTVR